MPDDLKFQPLQKGGGGGGGGVLQSCFEILKVDVFKKEVVMCH